MHTYTQCNIHPHSGDIFPHSALSHEIDGISQSYLLYGYGFYPKYAT